MNNGLIKKGVFAIAVVAMTATVGIVGFAHAATPKPTAAPQADGYGGGLDAFLAALQRYQMEIREAAAQYRSDVQACLGATETGADASAAATIHAAGSDLDANTTSVADKLSKKTAGSTGASVSASVFDNNFNSAANESVGAMDSANEHAAAKVATVAPASRSSDLRKCLKDARGDFLASIRAARQEFLDALHRFTHH